MTHEIESAPAVAAAQGAQDDRSGDAITTENTDSHLTGQYEFHPLANKFRPLVGKDFEELVDDIKANGLREEIVLHDGMILDGRNRYRACREAGVEPRYRDFDGNDPAAFVISVNIHRRHLRADEKRPLIEAVIKAAPEKSNRQIAAETGVSHPHVADIRNDMEKAGDVEKVTTTIDTKGRKQPKKKLTKAQKAEQAHRRRARKAEIAKNREHAIMAQLPDDIYDLLDKAESAEEEFREHTVDIWAARAEEIVDHAKAEAAARAAIAAWTRLADGIRKKIPSKGNDTDPVESAEARKAEFAKTESKPAPTPKKKRGRPPGSKNKKKT